VKSRRQEAPVVEMQEVQEETAVPPVDDVEDLALSSAVKVLVVKVVGSCEAGYVLVPEMALSFEVLKRRIATRFPGVSLANMKKVFVLSLRTRSLLSGLNMDRVCSDNV